MINYSGVEKDWLALEELQGKTVKVRVRGFKFDKLNGIKRISQGSIAFTTGKLPSGDPPEIEVKLMVPGTEPVSIPLSFLEPVHPAGAKENAIVIAGEHLGKEVVTKNAKGVLWDLVLTGSTGNTHISARPEHLVVRSRFRQ
jgi:hypothetical protein